MRRFGIAMASLLVLSGLTAASAVATTALEISEDNFKMAVGEEFRSFVSLGGGGVGYSPHEGVVTIETNPGAISCPEGANFTGLAGKLQTNDKVTDKIKVETAFGRLNAEESCSNTTSLGASALVHLMPQGGFLELNGEKGTAKLKEPSTTVPILLEIAYSGGTTCTYTTTKLVGKLALEASFEPYEAEGRKELNIQFVKRKVTPASGIPAACPTVVTITAPLGVQAHKAGAGYDYVFGRLL